jgi:hypothetical protein
VCKPWFAPWIVWATHLRRCTKLELDEILKIIVEFNQGCSSHITPREISLGRIVVLLEVKLQRVRKSRSTSQEQAAQHE